MGKCVYIFNGQKYNPESFFELARAGQLPISQHLDLGKRISIDNAKAYIKQVFGEVDDKTFRFVEQHILYSMSKPHEYLVGLMENGIANFIKFEDGTTSEWVLRHEVFHVIFNYYMTEEQRRNRIADLIQIKPEYAGKSEIEIEEALADMFQDYAGGKFEIKDNRSALKKFFDSILEFFGLKKRMDKGIREMFKAIDNGTFSKQSKLDRGYLRRTLKTDIKEFGLDQYGELMYGHAIPLLKEIYERLHNDTPTAIAAGEMISYLKKEVQIWAEQENNFQDVFQRMLEVDSKTNKMFLETLIQDAFPDLRIIKVKGKEESKSDATTQLNINDAAEVEETQSADEVSLKDLIAQFDQIDYEKKLSDEVKAFLNFVPVPDKGNEPMSPRAAFYVAAKILNGFNFRKNGDIIDIIDALYKRMMDISGGEYDPYTGVYTINNMYVRAVGEKIKSLILDSYGRHYNADKQPIGYSTLPINYRYKENIKVVDEKTIYQVKKEHLKQHLNSVELSLLAQDPTSGVVKFTKTPEQSTVEFIKSVSEQVGTEEREITALFKQEQARNRLAEVYNLFGSFHHKNLYIAEKVNNYGVVSYKYFPAQVQGAHLAFKHYIVQLFSDNFLDEDGKPKSEFTVSFDDLTPQKRRLRLQTYLYALGIKEAELVIKNSSDDDINTIADSLKGIHRAVKEKLNKPIVRSTEDVSDTLLGRDAAEKGSLDIENDHSNDIDPDEEVPLHTIGSIVESEYKGGLNRLATVMAATSGQTVSASVKAGDGKKMYMFTLGSQAHAVIKTLIDRKGEYFPHLGRESSLKHNGFVTNNRIKEFVDYDSTKIYEDYVKTYDNETPNEWLSRTFNTSFLDFISNKGTKALNKQYVQYFYTMDRNRLTGGVVDLRRPKEIKADIKDILTMMAERPELTGLKDYNRNSVLNFDVIRQVANQGVNPGAAKRAGDFIKNMTPEFITDELINDIYNQMDANAQSWAQQLIKKEFLPTSKLNVVSRDLLKNGYIDTVGFEEQIQRLNRAESVFKGKDTKKDGGKYKTVVDDVILAARVYYMNHYVNSYLLDQIVLGDYAFFADGGAVLKRNDKAHGPGTRGLIGLRIGMKPDFNVLIVNNPKVTVGEREGNGFDFMNEVFFDENNLDENGVAKPHPIFGEKFDPFDGQGFMLPERAEELRKGFGRAANMGNIFKGIHYEVAEKIINGKKVYVPVMVKYSSVVLTDEMVEAFPKLKTLRDNMRENKIDEFLFPSAVKVGTPTSEDKHFDAANLLQPGWKMDDDHKNSFHYYKLSNRNYRIQLNPVHEVDSTVAQPSQLIYFLQDQSLSNSSNFEEAQAIYRDIAKLMHNSSGDLFTKLVSEKDIVNVLINKEFSKENERLKDLLKEGVSINFPQISTNVIMNIISHINKSITQIRFPGSKLILQADYGITIKREKEGQQIDDRLRFVKNPDGTYHAEVIVSGKYRDLVMIGDFLSTDAFGFRIPSSELHSAVPLKIVGFNDSLNSNSIIAPRELVALHGSDFDVDSLFVLRRSNFEGKEIAHARTMARQYIRKQLNEIFDELDKLQLSEDEKNLLHEYRSLTQQMKDRFEAAKSEDKITAEEIENRFQTYIATPNWSPKARKRIVRSRIYNFDVNRARIEFAAFQGFHIDDNGQWVETTNAEIEARALLNMRNELSDQFKEIIEKLGDRKKLFTDMDTQKKQYDSIIRKMPVGYRLTEEGKFELDPNYERMLDEYEATLEDEAERKVIKSLREKLLKNRIVEGMIKFVTNPQNRRRMMTPIKMGIFNAQNSDGTYADNTIFKWLVGMGVPIDKDYDLSDVRENQKAYQNVFEGNSMVGKFANGMKGISYLLHSAGNNKSEYHNAFVKVYNKQMSIEKYERRKFQYQQMGADIAELDTKINKAYTELSELRKKLAQEYELISKDTPKIRKEYNFSLNGIEYDSISEIVKAPEGNSNRGEFTWTVMDALLNASIDNLKEQILPVLNINDKTFKSWMGMLATGVDVKTITAISRQPVTLMLSDYGSFDKGYTAVKASLNQRLQYFKDEKLKELQSSGVELTQEVIDELTKEYATLPVLSLEKLEEYIEDHTDIDEMGLENVQIQLAVMEILSKTQSIGNDISTFARAISNTLTMKSKPADFRKNQDDWAEIGELDYKGERVQINAKDTYSFNLSLATQNIPHLNEALLVMHKTQNLLSSTLYRHKPAVTRFIDNLKMNLKLDFKTAENTTKLTDELIKFVASSVAPDYNDMTETIGTGEESIKLRGSDAFQQDFAKRVKALLELRDKNEFINRLSVQDSKSKFSPKTNPRKYIGFHPNPNMEYHEILELEQQFSQLAFFTVEKNAKGDYIARELAENEMPQLENGFTQLQRDFVNYSLITNGLSFSSSNYNGVLPIALVKEYADKIDRAFNKYSDPRELAKVEDLFKLALAINNADKLPYVDTSKYEVSLSGSEYQSLTDAEKESMDPDEREALRLESVKGASSGMENSRVYDLRLKSKDGKGHFPEFLKHFRTEEPFILVYEMGGIGYYKRLNKGGAKSFGRNKYHLTKEAAQGRHHNVTKFNVRNIIMRVRNTDLNIVQIPNSMNIKMEEGMQLVLHNRSDLYYEFPRHVEVVKVFNEGKSIEVKDSDFRNEQLEIGEINPYVEEKHSKVTLEGFTKTEMSLEEMVAAIKKTPQQSALMDILLQYVDPKMRVYIDENLAEKTGGYFGISEMTKGVPAIILNAKTTTATEVLIHEMLHAGTANIINSFAINSKVLTKRQTEAIANLYEVFDVVRGQLSMHQSRKNGAVQWEYGLTDIHEFISEAFADPRFQAKLKSITVKNETLWQKLIRAIQELFLGKDVLEHFGLKQGSETALEFVIENAMVLMEEDKRSGQAQKRQASQELFLHTNKNYNELTAKMAELSDQEVEQRIKECK